MLFSELEEGKFAEAAACGTAAIITPVKRIVRGEKEILIGGKAADKLGPGFETLLNMYKAVQVGEAEDTEGWMWPTEGL